jgi:hypothetical protein
LGEGGARGDRAGALPVGKTHLYHHGQGLESVLESNPPHFIFQPFLVTVGDERSQVVGLVTMKDGVDGMVTGDVLYLTTAEVITSGQLAGGIG